MCVYMYVYRRFVHCNSHEICMGSLCYVYTAGPDDYSPPAPFQVTFSAADISSGVAMQCLNITIEDDSDVECDHDFTVGIDSTSPMVSADLSANVTVTISDTVDGTPLHTFI